MTLLRAAAAVVVASLTFAASLSVAVIAAAGEEATWSGLEQPIPLGSAWPVGLGNIGDIAFWAPNRGALITEGHPPTVPAGLWAYNGAEWHEYATVCGASQRQGAPDDGGRIAWASPDELWTVSDGRRGQANESAGTVSEREPPLEDNTLCHFAGGQVVGSYAHPAFQANSYQLLHAAACLSPSDCWFGGDPLEEPQVGAFHLHWNGSSLEEEPYVGEGHAVEDMLALEGHVYESVLVTGSDRGQSSALPVLHRIGPEGRTPTFEPEEGLFDELPGALYESGELAKALDFLHLSAAGGALWAAAGPKTSERVEPPHVAGQVTVARAVKRSWTQLIGPEHPLGPILPTEPGEEAALLGVEAKDAKEARVSALAAEPGTSTAWLALAPPEESPASKDSSERAVLVHISAEGAVLGVVTLPSAGEEAQGIGPKGAAARLACPTLHDCWLATTQGWLFHLAPAAQRTLPRDEGEAEYFHGLITYRPPDQGLPQVTPDAPPEDDSGLPEGPPPYPTVLPEPKGSTSEARVAVALLSHLRSRLLHGDTLELRFHLAVRARVRLVARRRRSVVAATPTRTLAAGERSLLLRLDPRRWPTKLGLQTHALAKLPTMPAGGGGGGAGPNTVSTGLAVLPHTPLLTGSEALR